MLFDSQLGLITMLCESLNFVKFFDILYRPKQSEN
jgi:hypothetical protein